MSNNPIVSIITPSYNQGNYLEQTIESVLAQTYPHIQYIIIDGGSTDHSVDIIKKYEKNLHYWVSEKDYGQADAINKGIAKASGDIIAYLNSDDLLQKDAIEQIVKAFTQWPDSAVIYGTCALIDEHNKQLKPPAGAPLGFYSLLIKGMLPAIHQPACFFNLRQLKRRPVFVSELEYVMDYELLLYCKKSKLPVKFIPMHLANFRVHKHTKTMSQASKMYEEKMEVQRRYGPYLMALWAFRYIKHMMKGSHT
jgi:glycosyltransferase involved in cell wall biosynthesis